MPQFITRQSFAQPQPQAASLPFSFFGGQRPALQPDTTGGIAFPDAGQPQPSQSPLSPFMLPTGLSRDELNALLGRDRQSGFRTIGNEGSFNLSQFTFPQQQTANLSTGNIPFEGGNVDKFNPVLAGGQPIGNINLAQSTTDTTNQLNKNLFGGF